MRLRARGDLCFIRPEERPTETESGLQLVYDKRVTADRGSVVAIGPDVTTVPSGARVLFAPDSGSEVICEKETFIAMRETDVLAIIEE